MCPHHQEKTDKMEEGGACEPLVGNGPNAGDDGVNQNGRNHIPPVQENQQGAAGRLVQADEDCKDNQDQDTEMKALNGEDKEAEPENNQQNGPSGPSDVRQTNGGQQDLITPQEVEPENNQQNGPSDVGQTNGGQQDLINLQEAEPENNQQNGRSGSSDVGQTNGGQQHLITPQDTTQQSPSISNFSSQYVALPPENSPSMSPDTPSQSQRSSNQVDEEPDDSLTSTSTQPLTATGGPSLPPYENVAPSLKNPDADVSDEDIEVLAAIVADNEHHYNRKHTFLRHIMGYTMKSRVEETIDKNDDRNTQLVQFLIRGWRAVAASIKRSDLAAKIRNFDESLEREFIRRINELDKMNHYGGTDS